MSSAKLWQFCLGLNVLMKGSMWCISKLVYEQNHHQITVNIFKCIFLTKITKKINFFLMGLIDIESIFVLVMAGQQTITWTNDDPVHWHIYYSLSIYWYNITRYCTLHNKFEGKTLVRQGTHERHPYLTLMGEVWVSFVSYLENIDHDILRACELFGEYRPWYIEIALYFGSGSQVLCCLG